MRNLDFDPFQFVGVPYHACCYPGRTAVEKFRDGCNCQLFALGVLASAGFLINPCLRSKELWEDQFFTYWVGLDWRFFRVFDILFFLPLVVKFFDPRKLHIGIYIDVLPQYNYRPCVLHNAKPGPSVVWRLEEFEGKYELYGAKRHFETG